MSKTVLHYIYDPFCGWCYGAAPLIQAASKQLPIVLHGGGLKAGEARQFVNEELREYVLLHDQHVASLTGQVFGNEYSHGLLQDPTMLLDSEPPIAAILVANRMEQKGLEMLEQIQVAYYVEGKRISEQSVLIFLAKAIGLDMIYFSHSLRVALAGPVQVHIRSSLRLMSESAVLGVPSCMLESDGQKVLLDIGKYMGKPEQFSEWLRQMIEKVEQQSKPPTPSQTSIGKELRVLPPTA